MNIIFSPTKEVIALCDEIDFIIGQFFDYEQNVVHGKYESISICRLNILHSIRLLEALTELARKDLVFVQGALVISRSLFELLIKTAWILHPVRVMEKEARYVAYLETDYEFSLKMEKETAGSSKQITKRTEIKWFINALSEKIKEHGVKKIPKFPNVRDILKSLNEERKYLYFIMLSQYTHFSHYAAGLYQKNLGTAKEYEETNNLERWKIAFGSTIPAFLLVTEMYAMSTSASKKLWSNPYREKVNTLIMSL
jgi:hypothetical protein